MQSLDLICDKFDNNDNSKKERNKEDTDNSDYCVMIDMNFFLYIFVFVLMNLCNILEEMIKVVFNILFIVNFVSIDN